jgi:FtsZ-interacting cell division protein YlmF
MASGLSRVAAFILGPSVKDDEDDFEAEFAPEADNEPTDIVARPPAKPAARAFAVHEGSVTSLDQRRRHAARPMVLSEIVHVRPYAFAEAAGIGENFKEGKPIILNLTTTDEKQAQKLIDFCAGMAFVTDGKLEKITPRVFIVIPSNVALTEADRSQLADAHTTRE